MNILIVGVGNIGKRHLESLSKFNKIKKFYIVEKNNSIKKKLKKNYQKNNFFFYDNIINLENIKKFDLAIISTNSDIRFKIFKDITNKFTIKYIILEKFVFQNINQFNYAYKIIKSRNLKVFINCPMRIWPFFKNLKSKLYSSQLEIIMTGSKWGLGSNAIHYIDLLVYLTNKKKIHISNIKEILTYKSKRKNFIEFAGSIDVKINKNNSLKMIDDHRQKLNPIMYLKLNNIFYELDAGRDYYYVKKFKIKNKEKELIFKSKFKTPLQSELTLKIFKDILLRKKNTIPTYEDLFYVNKSLIKFLSDTYKKNSKKKQILFCPIT